MLTAFTARPIITLKQRNIKITSLLAHSDQLLVGLNTGALRVYRIKAPDTDSEPRAEGADAASEETELLREHEKFSKAKIEQLAIFREANILISLSGGIVSVHDLGSYELIEQLGQSKGASCFAATSDIVKDEETHVPTLISKLAVAVKRRLLLWRWHDGEEQGEAEEVVTLSTGIKSLTWASGRRIVVGVQGSYVVVDVESKDLKQIVGPGSIGGQPGQEAGMAKGMGAGTMSYIGMGSMIPNPLATGLGEGEMLLARDINSLFVDREGEGLGRRQVPWRSAPEAVGYSYPYLLALGAGGLEVWNPQTLTLLQKIELEGALVLQVPNPNISLAHQGKGFLVASERVVWMMSGEGYDEQVDQLVEMGLLDEAISLLEMVEETLIRDKQRRVRDIKMMKAGKWFEERKYRESLDLFAEVQAPPERVVRLYPEVVAGDYAREKDEAQQPEVPVSPTKTPAKKGHKKTESSVSATKSVKESPSKTAVKKTKSDDSETASIRSDKDQSQSTEALSGKELKTAVRELQAFLADVRRRLQRFFDSDQNARELSEVLANGQPAENRRILEHLLNIPTLDNVDVSEKLFECARLVDTTLFRAHMFATPSLAGSLFRIANFCDPGVVMAKLEETGRYNDLIDFLYGKKLHRQALERLQKFGQADETEQIDPQLHGPARTVSYLQNLPPELTDLILEFARWPIEKNPDIGMEIFMADSENAENLPRTKVLAFLESSDHALALRYLEHVIDELNDQTPELHQKLLMLYLERLKEGADPDVQTKFLTILQTSTQYSPAKILQLLPANEPSFFEARALVLSKMGNHKQALEIYVFKLHDPAKAEEYCNQTHLEETLKIADNEKIGPYLRRKSVAQARVSDPVDEKPSIYHVLLNLYLNPPKGEEALWEPAIEIMARHGSRLPASSTLEMIPKDLLVKKLEFYFRGRIRSANTITAETQVVAGLRKVEAVRKQADLLLSDKGKARKVKVDEERVCGVCHKRLGGSVISVFPDNSVVHLGCANRRQMEVSARA